MPRSTKESRRIWAHNAFTGAIAMARQSMLDICQANTTTVKAQLLAAEILPLLSALDEEIRARRVEPDGTVKELK